MIKCIKCDSVGLLRTFCVLELKLCWGSYLNSAVRLMSYVRTIQVNGNRLQHDLVTILVIKKWNRIFMCCRIVITCVDTLPLYKCECKIVWLW